MCDILVVYQVDVNHMTCHRGVLAAKKRGSVVMAAFPLGMPRPRDVRLTLVAADVFDWLPGQANGQGSRRVVACLGASADAVEAVEQPR